jgi:hypothetical protein
LLWVGTAPPFGLKQRHFNPKNTTDCSEVNFLEAAAQQTKKLEFFGQRFQITRFESTQHLFFFFSSCPMSITNTNLPNTSPSHVIRHPVVKMKQLQHKKLSWAILLGSFQ